MAIEEHHTILFEKYKYRSFPKTIAEACLVLSNWKNHYGGKSNNNRSKSNDGTAFATVMDEKQQKSPNRS